MSAQHRDILTTDSQNFSYIFEANVSVPIGNGGMIRCNVYKPRTASAGTKFPVLMTYGPYGKDVPYKEYVNRLSERYINYVNSFKNSVSTQKAFLKYTLRIRQSTLHGRHQRPSFGPIMVTLSFERTKSALANLLVY